MTVAPEQVLAYFGIDINEVNKCVCPFHPDTDPSMQVNAEYVYCFGCKSSYDSFSLAKKLLEKRYQRSYPYNEVIAWFMDTRLPDKSTRKYTVSEYAGDVPAPLVNYYQQCMTDELYQQLFNERLINKETAQSYHIGWRPDWQAWAIPFYRGVRGASLIDVLQFRLTNSPDKKYVGLEDHYRGSIMNAELLATPKVYMIILFGSFDAILAAQDGLFAVGMNGSNPFKKTEYDRIKQLFRYQFSTFVVPDNSPGELQPAYSLADLLGGQVKLFPRSFPEGTDYIDYRKAGHTADDFLRNIVGIKPTNEPDSNLVENILSLWRVGDRQLLAEVHAAMAHVGQSASDTAKELALHGPVGPFTPLAWANVCKLLWNVKTDSDLVNAVATVSQAANRLTASAW